MNKKHVCLALITLGLLSTETTLYAAKSHTTINKADLELVYGANQELFESKSFKDCLMSCVKGKRQTLQSYQQCGSKCGKKLATQVWGPALTKELEKLPVEQIDQEISESMSKLRPFLACMKKTAGVNLLNKIHAFKKAKKTLPAKDKKLFEEYGKKCGAELGKHGVALHKNK